MYVVRPICLIPDVKRYRSICKKMTRRSTCVQKLKLQNCLRSFSYAARRLILNPSETLSLFQAARFQVFTLLCIVSGSSAIASGTFARCDRISLNQIYVPRVVRLTNRGESREFSISISYRARAQDSAISRCSRATQFLGELPSRLATSALLRNYFHSIVAPRETRRNSNEF